MPPGSPLSSPHAHFTEGHKSGSTQSLDEQNHAKPVVPSGDGHEPREQKAEPELCFNLLEVHLADVYEFCFFVLKPSLPGFSYKHFAIALS